MRKEKKALSSNSAIKKLYPLVPVSDFIGELRCSGIEIGYTGLAYYRNLGIIGTPQKIKGYKERFYDNHTDRDRIIATRLICRLFKVNIKEAGQVARKLPHRIYVRVPYYYCKFMSKTEDPSNHKGEPAAYFESFSDNFRIWLFRGADKMRNVSEREFYEIILKEGKKWVKQAKKIIAL